MIDDQLKVRVTQEEFGRIVGVSQQAVSHLVVEGALEKDGRLDEWLLAYCGRLREQAAGRVGSEVGGLDLVQERAALAREQRIAQELKNAVARGEFAPVGLLADVLGQASSAVVAQFDQLEGSLRKACPGIDDAVMTTVLNVLARARNEWIRSTASLVAIQIEEAIEEENEEGLTPADLQAGIDGDDVLGERP